MEEKATQVSIGNKRPRQCTIGIQTSNETSKKDCSTQWGPSKVVMAVIINTGCGGIKAVGRCFRLGGPSAEGVRTVQVGPGACSSGKFLISDSLKLVFLHFGVSFSL